MKNHFKKKKGISSKSINVQAEEDDASSSVSEEVADKGDPPNGGETPKKILMVKIENIIHEPFEKTQQVKVRIVSYGRTYTTPVLNVRAVLLCAGIICRGGQDHPRYHWTEPSIQVGSHFIN